MVILTGQSDTDRSDLQVVHLFGVPHLSGAIQAGAELCIEAIEMSILICPVH